jgi:pimeloyl-ACP methyl ester carboxylesterase
MGTIRMPQVNANGLRLEIEEFGAKTDTAILLIMGFSAQMTMWPVAFCEGLAKMGFRVIRFDNRDIGLSQKLDHLGPPNMAAALSALATGVPFRDAPYRLMDMADDAAGVLDALGIERAHIVGASMGGMIAQMFAVYHGHRAHSVTSIMSTTARPGLPPAAPEVMGALLTPPPGTDAASRIGHFKKLWTTIGSPGFRATDAELQAVAEREVNRAPYDPNGVGRQMLAILGSSPRHEVLRTVTCPALVLHGVDDPLVPVTGGRDTAASIPGAKLVEVPGMGHDFTDALTTVYLREVGGFIDGAEKHRRQVMASAKSKGFSGSGEG